ncbi:MAG: RNHCP domain-containing protein [Deltaproteobacteria bacterium]|nr:RNHCP domain-containing protein [Deltaproteobacteria bacterium]
MSKAARKGVAAAVDGHAERREFVRARLAELADEEPDGRTERLLRRATGADAAAQVRKNPIARNEGFACAWCGKDVPPAPGGGIRNHCPWCLRSLHVDGPVPGDRASGCGGVMHPISFEGSGDLRVLQRCARCGHERRNGLHPHWSEAPDLVDPKLLGTSGGGPAGGRG